MHAEVAPTIVWANRSGGPLPDSAEAIAVDASGNVYVAGTFAGTATFGATSLAATVGSDLFLAKQGPNGNWLWAKNVEPGVPPIYPFHLKVDSAGNPVLMTTIAGDEVGDGLNLLYVAKFNTAGTATWTKRFKPGGLSSVVGGGLILDAANNVYLTGAFGNQVNFGGTTLTDSGNGDIFLLKLSAAGATSAIRQFGQSGPISDAGHAVALDNSGNVYLAARFGGTVNFGAISLTSSGEADVALVKLDSALNPIWAQRLGNLGSDEVFELARDSANNLLLLGAFSTDTMLGPTRITPNIANQLLVARFNPAGEFSWVTPLGPTSVAGSGSRGFVTDTGGNLLLCSGRQLFKLNAAGQIMWSRLANPDFNPEDLNGLAVYNYTHVFVVGSFSGTSKFDGVTLTAAGSDDALVGRLLISTTPPPVVTVPPRDQTVLSGADVTLTVTATGAGPLTYQWYFFARPIEGATSSRLVLSNVDPSKSGQYSVAVSNAGGATLSAAAQLTVNVRTATFSQQPASQTVDLGGEAQFTAFATGVGPLIYQWQFKGTNLPSQNSTLLVIRGARTNDAGPYRMIVGNPGGYSTSMVANLTVRIVLPTITVHPRDVTSVEGATVNFGVAVTGSPPFTFRWKHDGVDVPGVNSETLVLTGIKDSDAGNYTVTVSNAAGSVTSASAALSLLRPELNGPPFTWAVLLAGPCGGSITGLNTDSAGNILLAGDSPDMLLPGLTNGSSCRFGMVVAKLTADGRGLWRNHGVGTASLRVNVGDVETDQEGNTWVAGSYTGGNLSFGATTLAVGPRDNLFVAKFNTNGILSWAKRATYAQASDLTFDGEGHAYLAGTLVGSGSATPVAAAFGSTNVSTARRRPFIARVDPQGNFAWVRSTGAQTTGARGASVGLDPSGDLWFAGDFSGTLEYDTNVFSSVYPPPNHLTGRSSAFVARLDRGTGLPIWVQMYQGKQQVSDVRRIAAHPSGGALLACSIADSYLYPPTGISVLNGPGMLLRIDGQGVPQAAAEIAQRVVDAAVNPSGATLVATKFPGEFYFASTLFRAPNGQDQGAMLLLKPDLSPDLGRSVTGLKGFESTSANRVALSAQGDALMAGSFFGTNVVFGPVVARAPSTFPGGSFSDLKNQGVVGERDWRVEFPQMERFSGSLPGNASRGSWLHSATVILTSSSERCPRRNFNFRPAKAGCSRPWALAVSKVWRTAWRNSPP